jgi:hypothetical protein
MANDFTGNPIVLDTFTSAIDVASSMGFPSGYPLKVNSIEWQNPTAEGDTALITDKASGTSVFGETCVSVNDSIIKYFFGQRIKNLCIAASGVSSGKIVILLS